MLSEEFSAVRTALRPGMTPPEALAALAALSAIERHVQDMETALRDYDGVLETAISELNAQARGRYANHMPGQFGRVVADFVDVAKAIRAKHRKTRAALPAREKGTE